MVYVSIHLSKLHRIYSTKSETQYKLWTLGNNYVLLYNILLAVTNVLLCCRDVDSGEAILGGEREY